MEIATLSYLDNDVVDELWTLVKREGISPQRVDEVKANVKAKASFGLGNLISALVGELKGELTVGADAQRSVTTTYAAPYRLLFLLELLPHVKRLWVAEHDALKELKANDFIDLHCETLSLTPLPRLGEYWHFTLTEQNANDIDDSATPEERSEANLRIIEKFSTHNRAVTLWSRLQEVDERPGTQTIAKSRSALIRLAEDYNETLNDMMSMSDNDLTIGISLWLRHDSPNQTPDEWKEKISPSRDRHNALMRESALESPFANFGDPAAAQRKKEEREAKNQELASKALEMARLNSDTLIVTCFEENKLKRNVSGLAASGKMRLFGRVLTNRLDTRTRMITIQPITLSVAP